MSKTLAPSRVTSRDPKGIKFMSIVSAQYDKADLSEDEAQQVNDTPGLAKLVENFIAENRQPKQYADEEVESSYTYPAGYALKTLEQQTDILRQAFPTLTTSMDVGCHVAYLDKFRAENTLPVGAEGYFMIPRWQKVAGTYGEALEIVLDLLAKCRRFTNYRKGRLGAKQLRQSVRTSAMLAKCAEGQPGDFIILPAQLGLRHRGRSLRRAREVFLGNEFGLDAFTVACILLTHPEREQVWEQLHIDCSGDEYSPDADGQFENAPYFSFDDGGLEFGADWVSNAFDDCGSASGFLPTEAAA